MLALSARFGRSWATKAFVGPTTVGPSAVSVVSSSCYWTPQRTASTQQGSALFYSTTPPAFAGGGGLPSPNLSWLTPASRAILYAPVHRERSWLLGHPSSPVAIGWVDLDQEEMQTMNRNARRPKKANHGKRPCSRVRRRWMRRRYGAWRRN